MRLAFAMMVALMASAGAGRADPAPFYQGKTIQIVVNLSVGGPTDAEARLLARHLPRVIPGEPAVVVRNAPGAGGLTGVNTVGRLAQPDGLTLAYTSGVAPNAALRDPGLRVDLLDMPLVAIAPSNTIVYMRADYGSGVRRPEDILDQRGFWVAGLAPNGQKDLSLRMQMDMLGLDYHYLTGFPGGADIQLAIQRNEAQASSESLPAYRMTVEPLARKGVVTPLWYNLSGLETPETLADLGSLGASSFNDFCAAHCKVDPKGALRRANETMNRIGSRFLRMALLPPGSPREAIATLRQAFRDLDGDPAFVADARNILKTAPHYTNGDEVDRSLREALRPGEDVIDFIRAYIRAGEDGARK